MKTSALLKEIIRAGGVLIRSRGSHRFYRFPNGKRVTIPTSGAHLEASVAVEAKARKAMVSS